MKCEEPSFYPYPNTTMHTQRRTSVELAKLRRHRKLLSGIITTWNSASLEERYRLDTILSRCIERVIASSGEVLNANASYRDGDYSSDDDSFSSDDSNEDLKKYRAYVLSLQNQLHAVQYAEKRLDEAVHESACANGDIFSDVPILSKKRRWWIRKNKAAHEKKAQAAFKTASDSLGGVNMDREELKYFSRSLHLQIAHVSAEAAELGDKRTRLRQTRSTN